MKYQAYPEYKDSGVEWLGEVPKHWGLKRISYIAILKSGDGIDSEQIEDNGNYPVYGGNGLRGYTENFNHDGHYILIGRQGALCGNINYGYGKFWASEHAVVVHPSLQLSFKWLGETLRAMDLNQYNVSAAQPGLAVANITCLKVPFPAFEEQEKIANFLDHETAKIDTLIEKQQQLIKLLKEKRQAVISHAVTKGLNPNAPMRDSGVEWLGEVPEHWEIVPLKHLTNIKYGIGEPPKYIEEGVALVRATNIRSGKISNINLVFVNQHDIPANRIVWLETGDIIVVRSGAGTGDSSIIPKEYEGSIAGFDMVVRPIKCIPQFLGHVLLSNYVRNNQIDLEKARAAQPHLNAEELGDCFILLPPKNEQNLIDQYITRELSKFDLLIQRVDDASVLLQERRTALISAAVTGKIDVRNWQTPGPVISNNQTDEEVAA